MMARVGLDKQLKIKFKLVHLYAATSTKTNLTSWERPRAKGRCLDSGGNIIVGKREAMER